MDLSGDPVGERLDEVARRLVRPQFLKELSPSRLPSQAASDASLTPPEPRPAARSTAEHPAPIPPPLELPKSPLRASVVEADVAHAFAGLELGGADAAKRHVATGHGAREAWAHYHNREFPDSNALRSSFLQARWAFGRLLQSMATSAERGFQTFTSGHADLVLAVDFNFYGTRMVTASSDQRLKVWDRKDDAWAVVDTWRAHDAEVVDVKWNGPFMGEVLGSIGEDGRFRLWTEDVLETPNSGRRFKNLFSLTSETRIPFQSFDFKNILTETYLALITRDAHLCIYEPVDHDNLSEWQLLSQRVVSAQPRRDEETGFKVCFHKEKLPCWSAIEAGLDRRALSLAVAAMDKVQIWRTDKERRFYVAAELSGARNIIRDLDWANGSMRGFDILATASKDGAIRIYELSTPQPAPGTAAPAGTESALAPTLRETPASPRTRTNSRNMPSGIGAGLANVASRAQSQDSTAADADANPGRVKHVVRQVAELTQHHGAVWRVSFSPMGDLLVSTGDDGMVRTWKRALKGEWLEAAEIDPLAKE